LLERLHQDAATNQIPVIVFSTSPQLLARAEAEAARYGNMTYLEKPFDLDVLLGQVDRLVGPA
jgi:CheY-like chemotaxis protein